MPIRCRECEASGLPHDEHATPEDLAHLRQLSIMDAARTEGMKVSPDGIVIGGQRMTIDDFRRFMDAAGGNSWLVAEAVASAAMARDPDGETHSVDAAMRVVHDDAVE